MKTASSTILGNIFHHGLLGLHGSKRGAAFSVSVSSVVNMLFFGGGAALLRGLRSFSLIGMAVLPRRLNYVRRTALPSMIAILLAFCLSAVAQIQQTWVAKYNNRGITNGNHQALKMALDSSGNIYVLGVSANANTNTGYAIVKYAPNGNQLWSARYDSANFPTASPTGFALDTSNNVVITGSAVTVKYDATGNLLWTEPHSGRAIAIDNSKNTYITGVSGNFTTVKLAPSGSNIWTTTWIFDGAANTAQAIAVDSSNNLYVAGSQTVVQPRQNSTMFGLVKYDTNGNEIWATGYGGGPIDGPQVVGLAVDRIGFVYVELNFLGGLGVDTGYQTFKYASDGTLEWQGVNPTDTLSSFASGLVLDSKGAVVITGENDYNPLPSYGTYKIDTNGNYIWANSYPVHSYGGSAGLALAVDSTDNIYLTGESSLTNAPYDIATLKLDPNGNQLWVQRYKGPGLENAGNAIAVDDSGSVYVAGYETESNGFTSMILIKYSPVTLQKQLNGSIVLRAYGSPGESFDLQASTNLQTWVDLGDIIADTNGLVQFADTNAPLFPARFYYANPQ